MLQSAHPLRFSTRGTLTYKLAASSKFNLIQISAIAQMPLACFVQYQAWPFIPLYDRKLFLSVSSLTPLWSEGAGHERVSTGQGGKGQRTTMPQWPFQKIKREPGSAWGCFLNMPWTPQGSVRTTETGNTLKVSVLQQLRFLNFAPNESNMLHRHQIMMTVPNLEE